MIYRLFKSMQLVVLFYGTFYLISFWKLNQQVLTFNGVNFGRSFLASGVVVFVSVATGEVSLHGHRALLKMLKWNF